MVQPAQIFGNIQTDFATIETQVRTHTLSTANLVAGQSPSSLVLGPTVKATPALSIAGAAQLLPATQRNSVAIINPTDGQPVYAGQNAGLNASNGLLIPPGGLIKVSMYIGPIWLVSAANVATSIFYALT